MLAEHRLFVLPGGCGLHADVCVIPTGILEVSIMEKNDKLKAEFDQLYFHVSGRKTELVCKENEQSVRWQLNLTNNDARELALLIERAEDEYEILMRDL